MTAEQAADLRALIARQRVLALGVVVEESPYVGLLPGAEFAALIHEGDRGDGDPLQLRRATLHGRVVPLARDTDPYLEARERYLARLPTAAVTFQLGDFALFALHVESGRYIGGFAQAVDVRAADLRDG